MDETGAHRDVGWRGDALCSIGISLDDIRLRAARGELAQKQLVQLSLNHGPRRPNVFSTPAGRRELVEQISHPLVAALTARRKIFDGLDRCMREVSHNGQLAIRWVGGKIENLELELLDHFSEGFRFGLAANLNS